MFATLGPHLPVCDFSPSTVTRRLESDWETCDSRRQKLQKSLVRTAEHLAGMALSPPQGGSQNGSLVLVVERKIEREET